MHSSFQLELQKSKYFHSKIKLLSTCEIASIPSPPLYINQQPTNIQNTHKERERKGIVSFAPACILLLLLLLLFLCAAAGGENPPPTRKKVAVEGVVYCKVCARDPNNSFYLVSTLEPTEGAVVRLQCNNTARSWEEVAKTGGGGKFLIQPERVSSWGAHKCRLFLVSTPRNDCFAPHDEPYIDSGPWKNGFPLTKTNSTLTVQYYTSALPLLYFYYWPSCM